MNKLNISGSTFLVSDIHLGPDIPQTNSHFYDFLFSIQSEANALFIIGDLFEVWIGDDLLYKNPPAWLTEAIEKLTDFASAVPTYFIHGNRDFLIGKKFSNTTGIKLLPEEVIIKTQNEKYIHISHGDQLCLDDPGYIKMRKLFRNKLLQRIFLSLSINRRTSIANKIRGKSKLNKKSGHFYLDIAQRAVDKIFFKNPNVSTIIHGHTHRPAIHEHGFITRYVLPDWDYDHDSRGGYLVITSDGQIITKYSIPKEQQ